MEKKEIIQQLKDSLEVATIRLWVKMELGMVLVVCVLHYLTSLRRFPEEDPWIFYGVLAGLILVPIFGAHGWELFRIFRSAENYRFYETKLIQPHSHTWTRSMYFTVLLQDEEGTIVANTHSIFGTHRYQIGPIMEEYLNKTVTVAYNEDTGETVVIG